MAAKKKGFNWGAAIGIGAGVATIVGVGFSAATYFQSKQPVKCQCGNPLGSVSQATPFGTIYHCASCGLEYEWREVDSPPSTGA